MALVRLSSLGLITQEYWIFLGDVSQICVPRGLAIPPHIDAHRRRPFIFTSRKMASCVAKSAVFASSARPNKASKTTKTTRHASKLWTPKSAAVDSPTIIVEGDAASKMAGLTAQRREVILDMEDFAENEVRKGLGFDCKLQAQREPLTTHVLKNKIGRLEIARRVSFNSTVNTGGVPG